MHANSDPFDGSGPENKRPGPLAGVFATWLLDFVFWIVFVFAAFGGVPLGSGPGFAAAMTLGFVAVGAITFWLARRRGNHEFANGVIIATSIVVLLSATCWGSIGFYDR
jgi:hypothetical protein